ncbi:hypothetical protein [Microbacterium sp. MTN4-26]|uniref:hypothetical protein n=1 Tax=unclassified Microbacterium TaxID=2609290 RepID=UPI0036F2E9D8
MEKQGTAFPAQDSADTYNVEAFGGPPRYRRGLDAGIWEDFHFAMAIEPIGDIVVLCKR